MVGYYRRFIDNLAAIVKPLTKCLKKKEKVTHTPDFIEAFEKCKTLLCNDPILTHPDFTKAFELTTDASEFSIGSVLSQNSKPICYASRTLNAHEINYSTIEKELLSIVWACKNFRPYLFGRKFTIYTDHKPLVWLFSLKDPASKLVRWKLQLQEYDFEIKAIKGKTNHVADALSRVKIPELNAIEDELPSTSRESMIVNLPDISEQDIESVLNESVSNNEPIATLEDLDNLLDPVENNDSQTIHSALEEPIFTLPYTDKPINHFKNQIIIDENPNVKFDISNFQLLWKSKRENLITFRTNAPDDDVLHFLKPFISLTDHNCFFFKTPEVEKKITRILRSSLKYHNKKNFVISKKWLTNILPEQEQQELIQYYHIGKTSHRGINEVTKSLRNLYYWPHIDQDVQRFINTCLTCQRAKYDRNPIKIKYHLTDTPSAPLQFLHADVLFIEKQKFLTIIDVFSKFAQVFHLPSSNSIDTQTAFLKYFSQFGFPKQITVDNGGEFKNQIFKEYCALHNIEIHYTTPGHSTSNSPIERFHSTLLDLYRAVKIEHPHNNPEYIILLSLLGYNNSIHSVTKHTPFEVIFGPRLSPIDLAPAHVTSEYIKNHVKMSQIIHSTIHENLQKTKEQLLEKRNITREDPPVIPQDIDTIMAKDSRRPFKHKPRFKPLKIIQQSDETVETPQGIVHKENIVRPRHIPTTPPDKEITPVFNTSINTGTSLQTKQEKTKVEFPKSNADVVFQKGIAGSRFPRPIIKEEPKDETPSDPAQIPDRTCPTAAV